MNRRNFFRVMGIGALAAPALVAKVTEPIIERWNPKADWLGRPEIIEHDGMWWIRPNNGGMFRMDGNSQDYMQFPDHTHSITIAVDTAGDVLRARGETV